MAPLICKGAKVEKCFELVLLLPQLPLPDRVAAAAGSAIFSLLAPTGAKLLLLAPDEMTRVPYDDKSPNLEGRRKKKGEGFGRAFPKLHSLKARVVIEKLIAFFRRRRKSLFFGQVPKITRLKKRQL